MPEAPQVGTDPGAETPKQPAAASGGTPSNPSADPQGVDAAEIRRQSEADFAGRLAEITGAKSLDDLAAKMESEAKAKLAEQGKFQELAEQAQAKLAEVQGRYQAAAIRSALAEASVAAIDADVIHALLAHQAKVADDGAVSIAGKPAAEAVAELLKSKPHLAKAQGGEGSGSGGGDRGGASGKAVTRSQWQVMTPAQRSAHVQAGGTVIEG